MHIRKPQLNSILYVINSKRAYAQRQKTDLAYRSVAKRGRPEGKKNRIIYLHMRTESKHKMYKNTEIRIKIQYLIKI